MITCGLKWHVSGRRHVDFDESNLCQYLIWYNRNSLQKCFTVKSQQGTKVGFSKVFGYIGDGRILGPIFGRVRVWETSQSLGVL